MKKQRNNYTKEMRVKQNAGKRNASIKFKVSADLSLCCVPGSMFRWSHVHILLSTRSSKSSAATLQSAAISILGLSANRLSEGATRKGARIKTITSTIYIHSSGSYCSNNTSNTNPSRSPVSSSCKCPLT